MRLFTDFVSGDLASAAGWKLNGLFLSGVEGVKYEVTGVPLPSDSIAEGDNESGL